MPSVQHLTFVSVCVAATAYQLWRVPRAWAFLLLFIVLIPKVPVAVVPGNPTPIRVDDLVIAAVLAWWVGRELFMVRLMPDATGTRADVRSDFRGTIPPSPATLFLLLYWSVALVCTLLGIAALTTPPVTGALHFARLIEYGLLYYFFYRSVGPSELEDAVRVFRFALLMVCGIWLAQHWMHAPGGPPTGWATLYPTFSATYDFGGYLMIATTVCYALWSTGGSRGVWTTLALAAGLYLTVNSDSRAALFGVALAVVFDIVVRARWRTGLALGALAAIAPYVIKSKKMMGLVDTVVAVVASMNFDIVRRAFVTDPSLALRLRNWQLGIEHWISRPLVGDGLGGYLRYTRQYDLPASPDGWYVRVLADTGLLGLVAFVLLMAALLWMLLRAFQVERQPLRRAIVYGAALALVATAASAVLVDTFVSYKIMGVFWMIVGVGTRIAADGHVPNAGVASDVAQHVAARDFSRAHTPHPA